MDRLIITDVALRDGLQNQKIPVRTADKIELAHRLQRAGVTSIEATSFVSPKHVPQMADAEDVIRALQDFPRVSALTPNVRALERASAVGVREVAVVLSATETMNRKNLNMSLDQTVEVSETVLREAKRLGMATRAYIAVAFECPYEGPTEPDVVLKLAERMHNAGANEIVIADTIGAAAPAQVKALLQDAVRAFPAGMLSVHFHDTRGMGLANAWAAVECGIRRLDASLGGLGGCPFAPGAAGNLATEDLVLMAEQSGLHTGIDIYGLLDAIDFAGERIGLEAGGRCVKWLRGRRHTAA